jgi:hypothetical protein
MHTHTFGCCFEERHAANTRLLVLLIGVYEWFALTLMYYTNHLMMRLECSVHGEIFQNKPVLVLKLSLETDFYYDVNQQSSFSFNTLNALEQ